MAGLLAFVGGGLLEGAGKALLADGKAKREAALEKIEEDRAQKRALELEEVKQGNRRGLLGERLKSDRSLAEKREVGASARTAATITAAGERRTEASRSAANVAKITAVSRETAATIKAGKGTDTTSAEDRIIKRHIQVDENGIETVDHEAAAVELEERRFKKAAAAQRRKAKGILDLGIRKRAEEFADQMVDEQSGTFSFDSSDFKDDGGSRLKFRARMIREFIAKNGGSSAPGSSDIIDITGSRESRKQQLSRVPTGSKVRIEGKIFVKRADGAFDQVGAP